MFGTPLSQGHVAISIHSWQYRTMITIDEAHKIFDRMPSYRSAFDEMRQLQELSYPIVAMLHSLFYPSNVMKDGRH